MEEGPTKDTGDPVVVTAVGEDWPELGITTEEEGASKEDRTTIEDDGSISPLDTIIVTEDGDPCHAIVAEDNQDTHPIPEKSRLEEFFK